MTDQVERQVTLPAPPSVLWRYLFEAELLAEWLADDAELDLRPGGEASFRIGGETRSGWVETIQPPRGEAGQGELVFWWNRAGEPASRVRVTLTPLAEEATVLRIVETRPLELLDLVGLPLPGQDGVSFGPTLVAA